MKGLVGGLLLVGGLGPGPPAPPLNPALSQLSLQHKTKEETKSRAIAGETARCRFEQAVQSINQSINYRISCLFCLIFDTVTICYILFHVTSLRMFHKVHRVRSNGRIAQWLNFIHGRMQDRGQDLDYRLEVIQGHTFWHQSTDHAWL